MTWTTDKPHHIGWYWLRTNRNTTMAVWFVRWGWLQ